MLVTMMRSGDVKQAGNIVPRTLRPRMHQVLSRPPSVAAAAKRHDDAAPVEPESDYDRETAHLAVRMLTARAAGIVLRNISQVDSFKAEWMEEYFTKHPPIEGNTFLTGLLEERPVYSVDPHSGAKRYINPAGIASAVLATRETLAQQLAKTLPRKVQDANVGIMRTHLETHTYVSGTNLEVKPSYNRRKQQGKERHQLQP